MTLHKDIRSMSLTPTACPMFEILATRLHQLQKALAVQLFRHAWHSLAERLDVFYYEDIVLKNRYNEGGAVQMKFDIIRNLYPLFAQYTERPESYFGRYVSALHSLGKLVNTGCFLYRLHDSCILLTLAKGSALLLRETIIGLEGATGVEDRSPPVTAAFYRCFPDECSL